MATIKKYTKKDGSTALDVLKNPKENRPGLNYWRSI